jgi:hypothetical protein
MKRTILLLLVLLVISVGAFAQQDAQRISRVEQRVSALERKVKGAGGAGITLFLFGAFCALWAQNSGRNSWLWFFLGLFFSIITVLVLLVKNAGDLDARKRG